MTAVCMIPLRSLLNEFMIVTLPIFIAKCILPKQSYVRLSLIEKVIYGLSWLTGLL